MQECNIKLWMYFTALKSLRSKNSYKNFNNWWIKYCFIQKKTRKYPYFIQTTKIFLNFFFLFQSSARRICVENFITHMKLWGYIQLSINCTNYSYKLLVLDLSVIIIKSRLNLVSVKTRERLQGKLGFVKI